LSADGVEGFEIPTEDAFGSDAMILDDGCRTLPTELLVILRSLSSPRRFCKLLEDGIWHGSLVSLGTSGFVASP
jgi:hypothetical protein